MFSENFLAISIWFANSRIYGRFINYVQTSNGFVKFLNSSGTFDCNNSICLSSSISRISFDNGGGILFLPLTLLLSKYIILIN